MSLKKVIATTAIFTFGVLFTAPKAVLAQGGSSSNSSGLKPLVQPGNINNPTNYGNSSGGVENFISNLIGAATIIAGLLFLTFLIIGGFKYATSGGDKAAIESAKNTITYALIGLAIVVSATLIVAVVQAVLGLDILDSVFRGPGPRP